MAKGKPKRITPLYKRYLYEVSKGETDLSYEDWKIFGRKRKGKVSNPSKDKWIKVKAIKFLRNGGVAMKV